MTYRVIDRLRCYNDIGLNIAEGHVGGDIVRELLQSAFGECLRVAPVGLEGHEFDNVAYFLFALVGEWPAIGFKFFLEYKVT
mgnify:FL=1